MERRYKPFGSHEHIPTVRLADFAPVPTGAQQYSVEFIERHGAIKLRESDGSVTVGVSRLDDPSLLRRLAFFHREHLDYRRIDPAELAAYLGRQFSASPGQAGTPTAEDERLLLDRLANDAPIVNLVNSTIIDAIRAGASDIHLEGFRGEVRVRYRIDGVLRTAAAIDRGTFPAVSSRIKIMGNLNIMERRLPQDGRITVNLGGNTVDMRISIVPIAGGESIVLRLFNEANGIMGLDELGLSAECVRRLREPAASAHGLVLVTGPTGSGKTTTLNAALREIRSDQRKIVTIEDPVEYVVEGIDQIQTNERIGLTFESLLRRVLRQDPDVIMVGEIRDPETAALAVRAALTGHLVFSTLHTNDAVSVIPRLVDMGVEPYLVAGVLRGALAQRLVRRLCTGCRQPTTPTGTQRRILREAGVEGDTLFRAVGCEACSGTGYRGRLAVSEVFRMNPALEAAIARREGREALAAILGEGGMESLVADGLSKVASGFTSFDEVERATLL
jgi:type II secretory ATPase GspE/PulE/Tfp pilus assembly ATPase PilB-like protein